jgi:hypothetical protein
MNASAAVAAAAAAPSSKEGGGGGIQVICAGLGRTGTLSLTDALKVLGYKPYHFVDFNHLEEWAEFAQTGKGSTTTTTTTTDDLFDLMEKDGYTATLENPTSDIYQDLLRRYPDAKVVLTVRDTPQAFVKSWKLLFDTMIITEQTFSWRFPSFFGYIPLFKKLKQIRQLMGTTHLGLPPGELTHGWRNHSDEWLAEQYERHNQHVIETVPKEQLLVFNVKEGWGPLCEFLGKKVPDDDEESFPHSQVNTAASLKRMRQQFLAVVYGWIPTLLTVGVAAGATIYLRGTGGRGQPTRVVFGRSKN